jgi:outer membrane protein
MAEAQHRQAMAGYWPQMSAKAGWFRLDQAPNFVFPGGTLYIPPQTVNVPAGTAMVALPANAFGPGFPPVPVQVPVSSPAQSVSTTAQVFPLPDQNIKLLNPENFTASGDLTWLLYDGGMRKGYREQANGAVDAARAAS